MSSYQPFCPLVLKFLKLPQLSDFLLLYLDELDFLFLLVISIASSLETLDSSFANEVVVCVKVKKGKFEGCAHYKPVPEKVGLVYPEGGHGDSVGFPQEVKV